MTTLAMVEDLDPFKDGWFGLCTTPVDLPMHTLSFERAKEALHHSISIAVAFAAHAHLTLKLSQHSLRGQTGVLTVPVGMVQQLLLRLASAQGHPQSRLHQTLFAM